MGWKDKVVQSAAPAPQPTVAPVASGWRAKIAESKPEAAPVQGNNWKKLAQLGGMTSPGSEWSMPDEETLADPTVQTSMKDQAKLGLGIGLGGAAAEVPALSSGFVRRALTGGTINAATNPEDPLASFLKGSLSTLGGEALVKGTSAAIGGAKRLGRTVGFAKDPVKAQDTAVDAVEEANKRLRASRQAEAEKALQGREYEINPRDYQGTVPEADDAIREQMMDYSYPELPSTMRIPALRGEKIRSALDAPIPYTKGAAISISPEVAAKYAKNKQLADNIRRQRAEFGGDDADRLYAEWSDSLNEAQALERSARNAPVSALSRPGTDATALRTRIDRATGTDLQDLGDQLRSAEQMRNADGLASLLQGTWGAAKQGLKGAAKGAATAKTGIGSQVVAPWLMRTEKKEGK